MSGDGYFVHESSYVDEGVSIGEGTRVWHFCHLQSGARIGSRCSLGQNVNVGNNVSIGDQVKIQNNVSVYEGVELEDGVFCGPSVVFTNINIPRSRFPQRGSRFYLPTRVREGASLGANATVVCGVTIGKNAFVGAGAVVTHDVPDHALVTGVPARLAGWMCACGGRLPLSTGERTREEAACGKCGRVYRRSGFLVEQVGESPRGDSPIREQAAGRTGAGAPGTARRNEKIPGGTES